MSNFESIICNQIAHRNVRLIGVIRDRSNAFLGGNSVTNATQKFRSLDPSGHTPPSPCLSRHHPRSVFFDGARERTDTSPVHATSTLDSLASDPAQLQACARRIASNLFADLGHVETTLLKPDGKILSERLDSKARENIELWMRAAGLPVQE